MTVEYNCEIECVQAPNVACESCIEREVEEYLKKHSNCYRGCGGVNNGEDE